jgi:glycerate dehydrogenase
MKIVVTDGYTLNPGDLSWDQISSFGELAVYDRTAPELIIERCKEADIVLTNKVPITEETLTELPRVKLISVLATGYNVIDIAAAKERNIIVCNVPAYSTASVAQQTFALLLELTNHVGWNAYSTAQGKWQQSKDFCYTEAPITELDGKVFGVVGFGNIGQQSARIAKAFGMKVIYYNPRKKETELAEPKNITELFSESDIVSLHCPLKEDNYEFVNRDLLRQMKSSAFLINTSRGQLINEKDLAEALSQNIIKGAALDVLSKEPPLPDNPLLKAKNCIVTPHTAWMSKEARQRIMNVTAVNIEAFLNQQPVNVVN